MNGEKQTFEQALEKACEFEEQQILARMRQLIDEAASENDPIMRATRIGRVVCIAFGIAVEKLSEQMPMASAISGPNEVVNSTLQNEMSFRETGVQ